MAKLPSPADVAQMLFRCRRTWLPAIFPHGRIEGSTFYLGDCYGSPGDSLPIPFDRQERITDFGSDWSGDDLDLYGRGRGHEDNEKAAWLDAAGFLGLTEERRPVGRPTPPERPERSRYVPGTDENVDAGYEPPGSPIPNGELATNRLELSPNGDELSTAPNGHARGRHDTSPSWGQEVGSWTFLTAEGEPWVDAVRFESGEVKNGKPKKAFHHYLWPAQAWVHGKILIPKPMLLFGLPDLLARPKDPVLVVGGEKCAEAAVDMGYLATTNVSGEGSVKYADLRPLAGRTVTVWRDNDSKGEVWQADLLAGLAKLKPAVTVKIVQPPEDAPDGWDIADALADDSGWTGERVRALVDEAQEPELPPDAVEPLLPFRWGELEGFEPPPLRFVVDSLIPEATVTGMFGTGGNGKTMLAQMLGSCCAAWPDFLGLTTKRCRVMGVFCEDNKAELWRRQARINRELGLRMAEIDENFLPVDRAGKENTLAQMGTGKSNGLLVEGPFMPELVSGIERFQPAVLLLDNILQMYAANVNDPASVTRFIRMMTKLAGRYNMAILLLGHVAKAIDSAFLGAQAWSDAMRSRMLLEWTKDKDEPEQRLILRRPKANYAPDDKERIELVWSSNGVPMAKHQRARTFGDKLDLEERKAKARTAFLLALDRLTEQGIHLSHSRNARNWAPAVMGQYHLNDGFTANELEKAMIELSNAGKILNNQPFGRRANRMQIRGIVRVPELQL